MNNNDRRMRKIERLCFWQGFIMGQLVWIVPLMIVAFAAASKGE